MTYSVQANSSWSVPYERASDCLLYLALLGYCVSETLLALGSDHSVLVKLFATCSLIICFFINKGLTRNLAIWACGFGIIFLFNYAQSFNHRAAIEELLRFLIPIAILATLTTRRNIRNILRFFIAIVLSNDAYQVYAYLAHLNNLPALIPPRLEAGYIIRPEGWVGFFSLFGFMNFCAYVAVMHTDAISNTKHRTLLSCVFVTFAILSTSLKTLIALGIYFVAQDNSRTKLLFAVFAASLVTVLLVSQVEVIQDIIATSKAKFEFYLIEGNSARYESYRVMFESLAKMNLTGEGLGSFGGPASTKYSSPLYAKYYFDWHGLEGQLATTDTFYPHLFVELGLVGAVMYLTFVLTYRQVNRHKLWWVVVMAFLVDNAASFSMLSAPYFYTAALMMTTFARPRDSAPGKADRIAIRLPSKAAY